MFGVLIPLIAPLKFEDLQNEVVASPLEQWLDKTGEGR